jgi:hypothetical protein
MLKEIISYDKEDMNVIVNDKKLKINILEYIEVKEKYEWYLKCLNYFGNFATYEHIATILKFKYSKTKVFNDLDRLCDLHFFRKELIGKNIYFVLTKKAQIYLKKKNNVGYIESPSDRAIRSNLLLADYETAFKESSSITLLKQDPNTIIDHNEEYNDALYTVIETGYGFEEGNKLAIEFLYKCIRNSKLLEIKDVNFLDEQIILSKKADEMVKTDRNVRVVKYYDGLSKLSLKKVHFIDFEFDEDNNILITFLILDNGRTISSYKDIILSIDNFLKNIYFNPIDQELKYNFLIVTNNIDEKEEVEFKLGNLFNSLKEKRENYKNNNTTFLDGKKEIYPVYLELLFERERTAWALNEFRVVEYNTSRFFEVTNDKLNNLSKNHLNIIDFSLKG